jgi:hypothetical protein
LLKNVRQTKTRRKPKNIHKTKDPAVNCNGWLGSSCTHLTNAYPGFLDDHQGVQREVYIMMQELTTHLDHIVGLEILDPQKNDTKVGLAFMNG